MITEKLLAENFIKIRENYDISLATAAIAMLCEELCAKKNLDITQYFYRMSLLMRLENPSFDSTSQEIVSLIATDVLDGDKYEVAILFSDLAGFSLDIVDELGVYEGSF